MIKDLKLDFVLSKKTDENINFGSSLQQFESSIFNLGFIKYPNSLVLCVDSIGTLLLFHYKKNNERLQVLMSLASKEFSIPESDFDKIRKTRNELVHEGFSVKDDDKSFKLLTQLAIPIYLRIYEHIFEEDFLANRMHPQTQIGSVLRKTLEVCKDNPVLGHNAVFSKHLQNGYRNVAFSSNISNILGEEMDNLFHECIHTIREDNKTINYNWNHWHCLCGCPSCDQDIDCDLNFTITGKITIKEVYCFWCGLHFSEDSAPDLAMTFMKDLIKEEKEEIIKEFGLEEIWSDAGF